MVPQFPSHCPPLWAVRPGRPLTLLTSWLGPGFRTCLCTQPREVARPPLALPPISFPPLPFIGCLLCTKPTASSFNPLHFCGFCDLPVLQGDGPGPGVMRKRPQQQDGRGWRQLESGCGLRALVCRLPVSLSQHLPLSGPQPPSPLLAWIIPSVPFQLQLSVGG